MSCSRWSPACSGWGEDIVDSSVQVLRSVPVLGLLPLVIIWFGIGEQPKVALVAIGTTFPIYINTYAGIRGVDAKLIETARTFGVGRWRLVRDVVVPGAMPELPRRAAVRADRRLADHDRRRADQRQERTRAS